MPHCPDCGEKIAAAQSFCNACGADLSNLEEETSTDTTDTSESASSDESVKGESLNQKRIDLMADYLEEAEEPFFILKGKSLKIKSGDDEEQKSGKRTLTALTDERVICVVFQRLSGNDTRSVEYESIDGVDVEKGMVVKRMNIKSGSYIYRPQVLEDDDEINAAMKFIREKKKEARAATGSETANTRSPTEKLKEVKELYDSGVLTEEEFTQKKQELIEQI